MFILIMGLSQSGKTTLAQALKKAIETRCNELQVCWLNADRVREQFDDWDFSVEGRRRQATRMRALANDCTANIVIIDMIAPLPEFREIIDPEIIIFMDTVASCAYEDTNQLFVKPDDATFIFREFKDDTVDIICNTLGFK